MRKRMIVGVKQSLPALFAGLGAMLAIGVLSLSQELSRGAFSTEVVLLMAAFGASAVLIFGIPDSPLAQPKNVILGHLMTAAIGLVFVAADLVTPFTLALASGLAVSLMLLTGTTHPPAGANPLFIMLTDQSWSFLLTPVLPGVLVLVLLGRLMRGLRQRWLQG